MELAKEDPEKLLEISRTEESPAALTYIAEALGELNDPRATDKLMALLDHDRAIVREGALLGLGNLKQLPGPAYVRIQEIAKEDPDKDIRDIAWSVLDDA